MAKFPKSERIKSKIVIDNVFKEGQLIKKYPFRLKYCETEKETTQILISVPKRLIKSAVKRNRVRRQIKEIYRMNKADLINSLKMKKKNLALFLIYTGKENEDFHFLEDKLKLVLKELKNKYETNN
jgi:ribonuclease P protein component